MQWYLVNFDPNQVPPAITNYLNQLNMTLDDVYALMPEGYRPSSGSGTGTGTGTGSGSGTGSIPSTPAEPEVDTRYHFSVSLGYRQELIDAELERKGLSYSDKLQPLEVAK